MAELDLHGIIPPVCTPRAADGGVDTASLERLCGYLLDAGVHGLFVGGSTGEIGQLTDAARAAALETVVGAAAGQVPVLAGIIDMGTPRVAEHARAARKAGVSAVVTTAPFYAKPGPAEVAAHYRQVAAVAGVPVIGYDIPSNVGYKLPPALVSELAHDGVISGLKDSSGDLESFRRVLAATADIAFPCFTGSETLADLALASGARGVVPGLGNVDPHGYVRLYEAARAGDWATARAEQERLARLAAIGEVADQARVGPASAALGARKAALRLRGIIADEATFPPLLPLEPGEIAEIAALLTSAGIPLGAR